MGYRPEHRLEAISDFFVGIVVNIRSAQTLGKPYMNES
jgi:hypothetical protein